MSGTETTIVRSLTSRTRLRRVFDMGMLDDDMKRVVSLHRLGFYATVSADGSPNLSPKGSTYVLDDDHLFFADIRSPQTVANVRRGSLIELNVVDPIIRKGYRFKGLGHVHEPGSAAYETALEMMRGAGSKLVSRVRVIVTVTVQEVRPLVSPVYDDRSVTEADVAEIYRALYGRID